ncbi:MAG TPA: VanZ family protein [Chthoniobacterales bacterium]|nr:VanZ family protein [Chthoniobacterales bacterium]
MNFRDFLKAWLPVFLWMALMFVGSTDLMSAEHTSRFLAPFLRWLDPHISRATIAEIHLALRKAAHVMEYAILTGLLCRALRGMINGFWPRAAVAFLPAMIFAAADEFHQRFVPSRNGSIYDVLVDYGGAVLGILICRAIHLALLRREKSG